MFPIVAIFRAFGAVYFTFPYAALPTRIPYNLSFPDNRTSTDCQLHLYQLFGKRKHSVPTYLSS